MGGGSHDLPRPRARAGRFRSSRCGGRSRPARSDIAVAVAAICGSSASRDPESRQPAADQTELTTAIDIAVQQSMLPRTNCEKIFHSLSLLVTNSPEYPTLRGGREPTFLV